MKKLKILLLFSILLISNIHTYEYKNFETGTIIECKNYDKYTQLVIKGKEKILVKYYDQYHCNIGDVVKVTGSISEIEGSSNFNIFDYKKYMLSKKIKYQIKADNIVRIKEGNIFYRLKNIIRKKASNNKYILLFLMGENELDKEIKDSIRLNGISHLFAISGMHITLFVSIISYLLEKIIKNKNIKNISIIIFLLFYMFLTNFAVSVTRASLLMICIIINKWFNFNIKNSKILLYLFLVFICYNPYYIYQVGFIFTFLITYTLILFGSKINKYNNYFIKIFLTSIISFLVSIPILINNFFQINFISILLNIFFIPFISFIIFPLSIISFIFPIFIPILNIFTSLLENISVLISNLTFLTFTFSKMTIYILIFYYLLIYVTIINIFKNKYFFLIILITVLFIHHNILFFINNSTFTMLDIGQGDSLLITLEHNKSNILIDTSGNYNSSNVNNILIPYFKSVGIKSINYLILTHGDYDHMGEAIDLVENFKVEKVIFNCGEFNELEKELIKVLDKKKIPYYSCIKELNIDNNKLYFLNNGDYGNENDNSSVIYTELNNHKFLFMGDAGAEVEEDLIKKYNLQDIDVLKVGHHGSKTSSSKEFINEINPKYSIISVGKNNRYGHPNDNVLDNLENSKIYRTDQDGSIMFKLKNDKLKIETCTP